MPIQLIAGLGTAGANYALGTKQMKNQSKFDILSYEEQQKLTKQQLANQQKQDTIGQAAQVALQLQAQKQRQKNIALIVIGTVVLFTVGGMIYYFKRKK
jgi:LPXTG-motif cell wall-anchored protein